MPGAPHLWVDRDPRGRSSLDLFDTEFAVLCGPPDAATRTHAADFATTTLGIPVAAPGDQPILGGR